MEKKVRLFVIVTALLMSVVSMAQNKKAVYQCSIDCVSCKEKIMKNIPYEKGVKAVDVDIDSKMVTIEYKTDKNTVVNLQKALVKLGYQTHFLGTPIVIGVRGNCDMCKNNIENVAKSVQGVTFALWNVDKKELTVLLNSESIDVNLIHNAIAKVGYDTDKVKADDAVYAKLPECCKYDR
ncbi:MAG: cation transporter [Marinilabiliaceae bacterium]|nr:cation transporter [Marinilabiliaceae bacterium]